MKGRVEFQKNHASTGNKLTKFSTLYDSLFDNGMAYKNYDVNEGNFKSIKGWLIKFYNALLDTREEFAFNVSSEKTELKKQTMLIEEVTWWGYAVLAKKMQDSANWKQGLTTKMNKVVSLGNGISVDFWAKTNPDWHGSIIKYSYNYITKQAELTSQIYNSTYSRRKKQETVALKLFS